MENYIPHLIIWLLISFIIGAIGNNRKIGFFGAFFLSILLTPIIGAIFTFLSTSLEEVERSKKQLTIQQEQLDAIKELPKTNQQSLADELQKLSDLRDKGHLTPEEFQLAKNKLLVARAD